MSAPLEVVRELDGQSVGHARLVTTRIPCVYHAAGKALRAAMDEHRPDVLLVLGQNLVKRGYGIARLAINIDDSLHPDNRGYQPSDELIDPAGPVARLCTVPIRAIEADLRTAGHEALVAPLTGYNLCNHVLYDALASHGDRCAIGALHLPLCSIEIADGVDVSQMVQVVTIAVEASLRAQRKAGAEIASRAGYHPGRPEISDAEDVGLRIDRVLASSSTMPAIIERSSSGVARHTHADLDRCVRDLDAELERIGMLPGAPLAIGLPRSFEFVAAVVCALRRGSPFVAVDPQHPAIRADYMMNTACVAAVVRKAGDRLRVECRAPQASLPEWAADAAYIVFTSGSSGEPKGCVVPRSALSYQLAWLESEFALSDRDTFLFRTPVGFDASIWEYLAPLTCGARLVIAEEASIGIDAHVRAEGITILQMVPSVLSSLLPKMDGAALGSLRLMFLGGESLPTELVRRFWRVRKIPVINLYGPSEITIQCASFRCDPTDALDGETVPIGRPLPGTVFRLSESEDVGVGELVVQGPGVASGYIGASPGDHQRFGVSANGTARTYRTGDLVEHLSGGTFSFRGRKDRLVKLRGQRIELDEVERALAGVADASAAVVHAGDKLFGIVEEGPDDIAPSALRAALVQRLPLYMIPGILLVVPELPRLPSGKIDHASLARTCGAEAAAADVDDTAAVASSDDDIKSRLAALWCRYAPLRRDVDFFGSGGDSLAAAHLMNDIETDMGVSVDLYRWLAVPSYEALLTLVREPA